TGGEDFEELASHYGTFGAGIAADKHVRVARAVGIFENLSTGRSARMHHFGIIHEPLKLLMFAAEFVVAFDELRNTAIIEANRRILRIKNLADLFGGSIWQLGR